MVSCFFRGNLLYDLLLILFIYCWLPKREYKCCYEYNHRQCTYNTSYNNRYMDNNNSPFVQVISMFRIISMFTHGARYFLGRTNENLVRHSAHFGMLVHSFNEFWFGYNIHIVVRIYHLFPLS